MAESVSRLRLASSRARFAEFRRRKLGWGWVAEKAEAGGGVGQEKEEKGPRERRKRYIRQYVQWLWPYRWTIGGVFFLALVSAGLDMVWPMLTKLIIDGPLGQPGLSVGQRVVLLNTMGLVLIALLVVAQAVESVRSYRMERLNAKTVFRLRQRLFDRLIHLPLTKLGEFKTGGIISRLSGDVDNVTGLVQLAVISPGVAGLRVVLTIVALYVLSWRLALAVTVLVPPIAAISVLWMRRVRPIYRSIREDHAQVDARVAETFGGIRVVRAFRREAFEQRAYAVGHHTIIRKRLYAHILDLVLDVGWNGLIRGAGLVILWFGGILMLRGQGTLGDIFAFQMYTMMLLGPIWAIVHSISQLQRSLAAMERVFEVLEMPPDKPDAPDALEAPREVREIRFEHVDFEYRPGLKVIDDFTLTVPGGITVALVGPSGAGKTTLTDLVARFHDPTRGAILLNGIDLRRFRLASYRRLLAVVSQEVFLFDGTIRENIAYGRRGATDQEIIEAAIRANADEFIRELPEGYDTVIGERGLKLSGGQRQRLSIARAILADPQILILDEATSNLDSHSEQLIQASLAELLRNRTTFVIAHRLSTVRNADLIVVMDRGRIVEVGTHAELLAAGGMYYDMVERQRQFAGEQTAAPA